MPDELSELTVSYYRCQYHGGFLETFYDLFLSKSPDVAAMFVNTEFKFQKLMLRQSLLEMICFDLGMAGTGDEIERLGRRHRELGVTSEMYAMWLDALCEAISKHDPYYSLELEQAWRAAMLKSIDMMIAISNE